jgi:hypothetical protein
LSRPARHIRGPADLLGRAGRDRVALADPADPGLVAPANREDLADREALAVPEDRADMSRAAQAITADTALVAPANQAGRLTPASRVGRAALVGMSLVTQADRAAPANRVDPEALGDRDPGQNQALLGRAAPIRAHLRLRLPDPHRMRARPHLTWARLQEPTHPEVATHRPVPIHPAEETHLAEAIRRVEATHPAEEETHEADTEGVTPHYSEFGSQSYSFENETANCIGAQMNN